MNYLNLINKCFRVYYKKNIIKIYFPKEMISNPKIFNNISYNQTIRF